MCVCVMCVCVCVRVGRKGDRNVLVGKEKREDYIPATQGYQVEEVMLDLLHVAATALKMYVCVCVCVCV